jgi:hypothetical protein
MLKKMKFAMMLRNRKKVTMTEYTIQPVRRGGDGGCGAMGCGERNGGTWSIASKMAQTAASRKRKISAPFFTWSVGEIALR